MNSFLTKVPAQEIADRGDTRHNQVMSLFPAVLPGTDDARRSGSRILFMEEGTDVWIRSAIAPSWDRTTPNTLTIPVKQSPKAGDRIRFHAVVNPIHRSSRGTRVTDDIDEWLASRTAGALTDVTVLYSTRSNTHTGRSPLILERVTGEAVVEDGAKLAALLADGIGRAKSYGAGLMVVQVAA